MPSTSNKRRPIVKLAGIGLYIHWTFSLLIVYIIYINMKAGLDPTQISWSVLFVLAMFVCVILHELGHALTARRFGIKTEDITLYPIGGVAKLERIPERPYQELLVSIAGPLVNIAIMLLLLPFFYDTDVIQMLGNDGGIITPANFLTSLAFLNVWLALFNLIPAFPMDGGRILRSLLAMRFSRLKATAYAVGIGKILAFGFIIAGFFYNPFLIFIGVFVILGAQAEYEMVKNKDAVTGLTSSDAMMSQWHEFEADQPLSSAIDALLRTDSKSFLIRENGTYVGTLDRDTMIKALRDRGDSVPIGDVCDRQLSYVDMETPVDHVFSRFRDDRVPLVLVMDKGNLVGVIDAENIAELILVKQALKKET
jgi:Zn-dependent protease/predicted transcriptional regulator